jgi:hypothetical protein
MFLGIGLRIGMLGSVFSPANLFASNEEGAWYDPSDLSTLFQDSLGTTPVTTAGDPVGLMLDKSKGLVLGYQEITNGDFATNIDDWTSGSGSQSWNAGRLRLTGAGAVSYQAVSTVVGQTYQVSCNTFVEADAPNSAAIYIDNNAVFGGSYASGSGKNGIDSPISFSFVAEATTTYVQVRQNTGTAGYIEVANVSVRSLAGNHARQATSAARPTYQTAGGLHYLAFDGVDDAMATGTITPGVDKAQVFAGVRKLSDAATGIAVETGTSAGTLSLAAPVASSSPDYFFASRGSVTRDVRPTSFAAPNTAVLTAVGDISGDVCRLRVNRAITENLLDQGTGNFSAAALNIGARNQSSLFFNGNIYGLILRFGANLTDAQIASTEAYLATRTGVTL